ncbi:MAG TPA: Clp protease N-terminal domain-containing protein, partial [Alphaproteobacteria bacterium]|nr:Clp protease N-terminal domain-containing protein [Alphaproteobacteria bacterium]
MDFDKFTEKTKSVLQAAQTLAMLHSHQSLEPEHLLKVMLNDEDGLTRNLVQAAGGDAGRLVRAVDGAVAKFPRVEGPGAGGVRLSTDLAKIVDSAV